MLEVECETTPSADDTVISLTCRKEHVVRSHTYALSCISLTVEAIVNSAW